MPKRYVHGRGKHRREEWASDQCPYCGHYAYFSSYEAAFAEVSKHVTEQHRDREIIDRLEDLARDAKYYQDDSPEWLALHRESAQLLREWWAHPEYIYRDRHCQDRNYFIGAQLRLKRLIAKSVKREDGTYCQGAFCFKLTPEYETRLTS